MAAFAGAVGIDVHRAWHGRHGGPCRHDAGTAWHGRARAAPLAQGTAHGPFFRAVPLGEHGQFHRAVPAHGPTAKKPLFFHQIF